MRPAGERAGDLVGDREPTKWITLYSKALTGFSSVERVFCIGPPSAATAAAASHHCHSRPPRLIYVFAGAKLSYFIIARHCSYVVAFRLPYRHAVVSAPTWLLPTWLEKKEKTRRHVRRILRRVFVPLVIK